MGRLPKAHYRLGNRYRVSKLKNASVWGEIPTIDPKLVKPSPYAIKEELFNKIFLMSAISLEIISQPLKVGKSLNPKEVEISTKICNFYTNFVKDTLEGAILFREEMIREEMIVICK